MALMECPECARQISNRAPTCPGCGAPIAAAATHAEVGVNLTTIQETSKSLKLEILLSMCAFWVGTLWMLAISPAASFAAVVAPLLLAGLGVAWYVLTKLRIWWHHK